MPGPRLALRLVAHGGAFGVREELIGDVLEEIARGGRELGIEAPFARNRFASGVVTSRRMPGVRFTGGLFESTMCHAERKEDRIGSEAGERATSHIFDQLLDHGKIS